MTDRVPILGHCEDCGRFGPTTIKAVEHHDGRLTWREVCSEHATSDVTRPSETHPTSAQDWAVINAEYAAWDAEYKEMAAEDAERSQRSSRCAFADWLNAIPNWQASAAEADLAWRAWEASRRRIEQWQ